MHFKYNFLSLCAFRLTFSSHSRPRLPSPNNDTLPPLSAPAPYVLRRVIEIDIQGTHGLASPKFIVRFERLDAFCCLWRASRRGRWIAWSVSMDSFWLGERMSTETRKYRSVLFGESVTPFSFPFARGCGSRRKSQGCCQWTGGPSKRNIPIRRRSYCSLSVGRAGICGIERVYKKKAY